MIAIDFDGTLSDCPYLVELVKGNKGKHCLITHRAEMKHPPYQLIYDMEAVGLDVDDFEAVILCPVWIRNDTDKVKLWKGEVCHSMGIKTLIDDTFAVNQDGCDKYKITLLHPIDDEAKIRLLEWDK